MTTDYYIYLLFRPNGLPCYVGKGKGRRWRVTMKSSHNARLAIIIAKAGGELPVVIIRDQLTEAEAFATEIALIAAIGRGNKGPLVNMTDGGEGSSGRIYKPTAEAITKQAATIRGRPAWNKGIPQTEAHRAANAAARRGKKQKPRTDEFRRAASERMKGIPPAAAIEAIRGRPSPLRGKPQSEAWRSAISQSRAGKPHPHRGRSTIGGTRAKISASRRAS